MASVAASVWLILFDGLLSVQNLMIYLNDKVQNAENLFLWLLVYSAICVFSQLLAVPSGSLILIAAGFIFPPYLAACIFALAQVLCSWPVYKLGEVMSSRYPNRFRAMTTKFSLPVDWEREIHKEGFIATVVLRLTPVIPSAAACLLAAGVGISLKMFIPATIAVCWIRPLFFASFGGSIQALTALPDAVNTASALKPLLLLFVATAVLLVAKLYIRYRSHKT